MIRPDEVDGALETIEKFFQDRLSDWEMGFIESIRGQVDDGKALTEKQLAALDKTFERVSNHGRG